MWSKENKEAAEQEETQVEAAPKKEVVVEAPKQLRLLLSLLRVWKHLL